MNVREEFGFRRNVCACRKCSLWCEYLPGALVPSDLDRLIPPDDDTFRWAEEHLSASPGFRLMNDLGETLLQIPTLVPKRQPNGHCHWLTNGMCSVHENSPFGCAFLSQCQQTGQQAELRNIAARQARERAFEEDQLYAQIWNHLWEKGLRELTTQENIERGIQEVRRLNKSHEKHKLHALKKERKKQKKKQRR